MFHSSHIHMPNRHRQRTALRTFFPSSSFSPPDSKEPLKRGILFSSVATVLLLVGCILTWLEFNDMFGGKISMTGPLLIAVALLMMLLSLRQFRLARKRNRTNNGLMQLEAVNAGGVTALVVDQEEGMGPTTVVIDSWEGDRPETDGIRVSEDLAPPSYTDVAQLSCSSNCPSFVSHDDRNEAPPTYEETCGMFSFDSESSLALSSRRRSSQLEPAASDSAGCNSCVQNDPQPNPQTAHNHSHLPSSSQTPNVLNTLSPGSALLISAWQRNTPKGVKSNVPASDMNETSSNASISSDDTVAAADPCPASTHNNSDAQTLKRADWGQRSFSSVPSYTCLLSESGEVSAQVFNTSSIISQMLPQESQQDANFDSFLGSSAAGPTRSHSVSSISNLRQGVPYTFTSSSQIMANPRLAKGDSPGVSRTSGRSDVNDGLQRRESSHQRSDSSLAVESNVTSFPSSNQASSLKGNTTTSKTSPENPKKEMADSRISGATQVPAVRGRSQSGHEILLVHTQDVQETI